MLDDNVYVNSSTPLSENVKPGDIIVVVRNGSRALIGKHAQVRHEMPNTVIGAFMTGIRSRVPQFINALLSTPAFENEVAMNMGATINQITLGMFGAMSFSFPSVSEQKAIGGLFYQLDSLITLHQRKYDKLCTVKKSMLDKMFPKPGETEPEIRFEGFTDPWEQRKLGELYSLVSEKNDLTFGRESIISVANMYFNANVNVTDEQYLRTYNVMRLGDIAFEGHSNKEFSHGRFVENYIGDGIVSHIFTVLRPRVPFDVNYWRYAINNEKLMRLSLTRSTKASTMMHDLVPSDFLREAIPTPTLAEQKEIGAFLVGLDHLITLHQRKLELLRNIKKSLLDRMFV